MRVTLELTNNQHAVLVDLFDTTLQSLVMQEAMVRDALDKTINPDELGRLNDFLAMIAPQRILLAEILHTLKEADPNTRIIVPG